MLKSKKTEKFIIHINERLRELSHKNHPLFVTLCDNFIDTLDEELDNLNERDLDNAICEVLDDELVLDL